MVLLLDLVFMVLELVFMVAATFKAGRFTLPIILCKHAYCIYGIKCVMRYKLVLHSTFGSTFIIFACLERIMGNA